MVRVLEDMRDYALRHGLAALAEHLDQARMLALMEIASLPGRPPSRDEGDLDP
jgi:hypothetical protein